MKKRLLATVLATVTAMSLMSTQMPISAEENENYEYVIPMEHVNVDRLANGYKTYSETNKNALYNLKGEKISDDYDNIGLFYNDDVAIAQNNNKYYIINSFGEVLSEYDKRVIDISDVVLVNHTDENEDGRPSSYFEGEFGVYNYWGELLAVLPYEKYNPARNSGMNMGFDGGRMVFKENDKWGAVDTSLNTVIEPLYDKIYPFYEVGDGVTVAVKDGKYGLIDKNGRELTDFVYDYIEGLHDDYTNRGGYKAQSFDDDSCIVFDKYGNVILRDVKEYTPYKFYAEYGLIVVYVENTRSDREDYSQLYGIIDTDGNIVIPIENVRINSISDGIIPVKKSEGHAGYYDINGNEITEFNYTNVSPFSEGLSGASTYDNGVPKNVVIDKSGNIVFETNTWVTGGFHGGIAKCGSELINNKGEVVIKNDLWKGINGFDWWDNTNNDNGCFVVSDGNLCGVVRYKGHISSWAEETVKKAEVSGIADADGNYDYVSDITREEFCELVYNYCTLIPDGPTAVYTKNKFADTDNEHIVFLNAIDIIKGKSETEFAPNDRLTREEAATIISRVINILHPDWEATELWFEFADEGDISDWATDGIQMICNMGIMNGVGDNRFAPQENFTTEQAIVTLVRCYENFNRTEIIGSGDEKTDIVVGEA